MKNVFKHSMWTGLMGIVQAASGMGLSILLARLLNPSDRGAYSLVFLIIGTASFVTNPCVYASTNYFLSSKRYALEEMFPSTLFLAFISGLFGFAAALISGIWLTNVLQLFGWKVLLLIGLGTSAHSISISFNGVFYGARRVKTITTWIMAISVLQFLVATSAAIVTKPNVSTFILIYVSLVILDAAVKIFLSYRMTEGSKFTIHIVREMLNYGGAVYVSRTLTLLSQRIDTYILYAFAGQVVLGYYSIATSLGEQLWILPSSIGLVMMTNIAHRPDQEASEITVATSRVAFVVPLLAAMALTVVGPWLIPFLYGNAYQPAVIPFLLVLPGIVTISSYAVIEPYFQSRGKPLIPVYITAIGAISNIIVCFALIPRWGMYGAALAYSSSYVIQLGVACVLFARLAEVSPWSLINVRLAIADTWSLIKSQIAERKHRAALS